MREDEGVVRVRVRAEPRREAGGRGGVCCRVAGAREAGKRQLGVLSETRMGTDASAVAA